MVRVSEEARTEYGFMPVCGHKVWVIRWRFGVLDDIVIAEFPMPQMTTVSTFRVPSSYDDVDTQHAVSRAALER